MTSRQAPEHLVVKLDLNYEAIRVGTEQEQEAITQAVREHAEGPALVATKESDRHSRELRELNDQQQKLFQLHYQEAVSVEVLKVEQQRIESERAQDHRWSKAATADVDEVMDALKIALALVDEGALPIGLPMSSAAA